MSLFSAASDILFMANQFNMWLFPLTLFLQESVVRTLLDMAAVSS